MADVSHIIEIKTQGSLGNNRTLTLAPTPHSAPKSHEEKLSNQGRASQDLTETRHGDEGEQRVQEDILGSGYYFKVRNQCPKFPMWPLQL